jgi:hypothetical protein
MRSFLLSLTVAAGFARQAPDTAAQREAIKKLAFLVGNRPPQKSVDLLVMKQ